MSHTLALSIKNDFDQLPAASEAISEFLSEHGAPADAVYLADLTLEELVTNIVKYGYDDENEHRIDITVVLDDGGMRLCICDDGHPFNPLDAPDPDTTLAAEDRPIGGLGIHLVRKMTDQVEYERRDDRNFVTITKAFQSASS
jgi:anti-sigma regulatory factor (Ser/Thr protein kinase)